MKFYHGTSKTNAQKILEEGFKPFLGRKTREWWDMDRHWKEFADLIGLSYFEDTLYSQEELLEKFEEIKTQLSEPDRVYDYLDNICFVLTTSYELAFSYAKQAGGKNGGIVLEVEMTQEVFESFWTQEDFTDNPPQRSFQFFEPLTLDLIKITEVKK